MAALQNHGAPSRLTFTGRPVNVRRNPQPKTLNPKLGSPSAPYTTSFLMKQSHTVGRPDGAPSQDSEHPRPPRPPAWIVSQDSDPSCCLFLKTHINSLCIHILYMNTQCILHASVYVCVHVYVFVNHVCKGHVWNKDAWNIYTWHTHIH